MFSESRSIVSGVSHRAHFRLSAAALVGVSVLTGGRVAGRKASSSQCLLFGSKPRLSIADGTLHARNFIH